MLRDLTYAMTTVLILLINSCVYGQEVAVTKSELIFSAIKGSVSKPDTIYLSAKKNVAFGTLKIVGEQASFFKLISPKPSQVASIRPEALAIVFEPAESFIGIAKALLEIKSPKLSISLTGLSTKGLEGENEASLSQIVDALGYKINIGWSTLPNHLKPELQGEELEPASFIKAGEEKVELIPVARYSPDFALNFGYYTISKNGPVQHQAGILSKAGKFPEHQTLFPAFSAGKISFDPGDSKFGLYAISPTHTVYSEDTWNILYYPTHATHAIRIYPIHDKAGVLVQNTYLVCTEEAANGDYNDYVFILKNVKPAFLNKNFTTLFNGKDLEGWHIFINGRGKDNDPEKIFTIQPDGVLHDLGKELGYIMTEKSFGNFHFVLEFKWGEKRWPPREASKRDSGICYNIPDDNEDEVWPPSVECQIQEGDVGDFWLIGNSTIQVDGKQNTPLNYSQIVKKRDGERPNGEWNTVEVISFNGKCAHLVNGVFVNYGENSSLIGGRILIQSEYAELYYRNIRIHEF